MHSENDSDNDSEGGGIDDRDVRESNNMICRGKPYLSCPKPRRHAGVLLRVLQGLYHRVL